MKTFTIKANAQFEAEDLHDAFNKLITHFEAMQVGDDSSLIQSGAIMISAEADA